MTEQRTARPFLRLVAACAIAANGLAALAVQGDRGLRPFRVGVVLDRERADLTTELQEYQAAVDELRDRMRAGSRP